MKAENVVKTQISQGKKNLPFGMALFFSAGSKGRGMKSSCKPKEVKGHCYSPIFTSTFSREKSPHNSRMKNNPCVGLFKLTAGF